MILYVGDSFGMYHTPGTWTKILADNLNLNYWAQGLGGTSIWYAYQKIMHHKHDIMSGNITHIILSCTHPQRIPHCKVSHESHYVGNPDPPYKHLVEECQRDIIHFGYFERFYDKNQHDFLYKKILEEIITEFSPHAKLVFLPCFPESHELVKEVYRKYPQFSFLNFPLMLLYEEGYNETNHFTLEINAKLAQLLTPKIPQQNVGPFDITVEDFK